MLRPGATIVIGGGRRRLCGRARAQRQSASRRDCAGLRGAAIRGTRNKNGAPEDAVSRCETALARCFSGAAALTSSVLRRLGGGSHRRSCRGPSPEPPARRGSRRLRRRPSCVLPALMIATGSTLAVLHLEDRHFGVLAVALVVELDVAGRAVVLDLRSSGRYLAGSVESAFCIAAIRMLAAS